MSEPVIAFDGVGFTYPGGVEALVDVSFSLEAGEFLAVVGANGSGKSTLARLCNGLLVPTRGRVRVAGRETSPDPLAKWEIRRHVGIVFQHPDNQLVAATVEEDVAFGPENLGLPPREIRERVDEALRAVGVESLRHRAPHQLSGGQKQLVAIAGVLAMRPKCLILDEATSMLDPAGAQMVLDVVRRLNRETGLTVIHITHEMAEVALADRVLVLASGRVAALASPAELFEGEQPLAEWGLELPEMVQLAQRLRRAGWPLPPQRGTVEEMVEAVWRFVSKD